MPIGKVKWYDPEKGFGFASNPGEEDVHISQSVLPEGVETLHPAQRIEFDYASGGRGPQILRMKILDPPRSPRRPRKHEHKYTTEQLNSMVGDLIILMESSIQPDLQRGRWPDRKAGRQVAEILRAVAKELDT